MKNTKQEAVQLGEKWKAALDRLSPEDERLLTLFRLNGQVVDPRYGLKAIRLLVAQALVDPEFRSRLIGDADSILSQLQGHSDLPENLRVRFVENSPGELTVVLPPPSAALDEKSRKIGDLIVSRTSTELQDAGGGGDDNDVLPQGTGDFFQFDNDPVTFHFGDPSHDGH